MNNNMGEATSTRENDRSLSRATTCDELKRSYKRIGPLYPILVDTQGKIIDGKHRAKADPRWPRATLDISDEVGFQKVAIIANVQRREVPEAEQKRRVNRLAKITGWTPRRIAQELGMSYRWVVGHLSEKYKGKTGPKRIARSAIISPQTQPILESALANDGFEPTPYDFWYFGASCDNRFGDPYPGRIPGQIIQNLLYFYTEPGDLVVDPMAGSGTTYDVCKSMNRRCLCYDISPTREVIKQHDLTNGLPGEAENADLVFLDPPYFKKKEKEYGKNSISALPKGQYLGFFNELAKNLYDAGTRRVALLMSDYTDGGDMKKSIFIWHYVWKFEDAGWVTERHIMAPLPPEVIHPSYIIQFRKKRKLARLGRSLVIFRRCD